MSLINRQISGATSPASLQDKVVLLVGGTNVSGPSLAASLAERGADVAVVYFDGQHQQAQQIKERVESNGQRCLTLPAETDSHAFPEHVIGRVVEDLGRLDIFIDYAGLSQADSDEDVEALQLSDMANPFSNFEMMAAAIGQMTDGERTAPTRAAAERVDSGPAALRVAATFIGKPVLSLETGTTLGRVEDLYVDSAVESVAALYLGREGLLDRSRNLIPFEQVETMGEDAVLVQHGAVVVKAGEHEPAAGFVRRKELLGLEIQTPGGTRIGRIGDLVMLESGQINGFTLSHTYVSGPIAENKVIDRPAIVNIDLETGVLMANLTAAEEADLQLNRQGLFGERTIVTRTSGQG